jgi:death on curing protein
MQCLHTPSQPHASPTTGASVAASPDLDQRATVLLESLVRNPALNDGNTRVGRLATMVFYG